jgi:hypothetical protein
MSKLPPHLSYLSNLFTRESLVEVLDALSAKIGYEIDQKVINDVSKEDLLIDLSWLFHQVGEEESLEVFVQIMQNQPIIH